MIDTADLAILETYVDTMNPVERGLVEELRRLKDESQDVSVLEEKILELEGERDEARSELRDAQEEVDRLEKQLEAAERQERDSDQARDVAERALTELKAKLAEVIS